MKKTSGTINLHDEALIPKLDLNTGEITNLVNLRVSNMPMSAGSPSEANDSANISIDPFDPRSQAESTLPYNQSGTSSVHDQTTDAANLSVRDSEGNLSRLEAELRCSDEVKLTPVFV